MTLRPRPLRPWMILACCLALTGCAPADDGDGPGPDAGATDGAVVPDGGQQSDAAGIDSGVDSSVDCVDPDGDGYGVGPACLGTDCAPQDPERHPGAVERCDLLDNDCNGEADELPECERPRIWVFLLAGQSNMVGLGINSGLSGADAATVGSTIIYYNPSVHNNTNGMQWLDLAPGFGVDGGRFGPELGFGRRLQQHWPGRAVAFIKVAEGATALYDRWDASSGDLYQLLLAEAQAQLAVLAQSYQPQVVGVLWMQGESDACSQNQANAYYDNFSDFVTSLRQDVGVEYLPVSAALIADHSMWPYAATVRNATTVVAQQLGQMEVVETTDLSRHASDQAHYDTAGNLMLGARFADAVAALLPSEYHFGSGVGAVQGDGFWLFRDRAGASVTPMTYDAGNARWLGSESSQIVGPGWMHPGHTRDAELVWWAPHAGQVQIDVAVSSADDGGGDGTWVSVARDDVVLWGPVPIPNGGSDQHSLQLVVEQGQQLQFRTSSGPAHDADNDTTAWQIDIQVLDVDP